MNKILSIIAILMMAATSWASITSVQPTVGEGTSASPYEIASAGNLVWFANQVNSGSTSICGKLTADVDLEDNQTMIGTESKMYSGTFDGCGHTVTVKYKKYSENCVCLFRYAKKATITRLATTGSITTSYRYAAGIVGAAESSTISRCASNVNINYEYDVNSYHWHGGITGYCENTTVTDCIYYGNLRASRYTNQVERCSGIVGKVVAGVVVNNCLVVVPDSSSSLSFGPENSAMDWANCYTIANTYSQSATITNCYYNVVMKVAQGTKVTKDQLESGEICYKLNNGISDGTQSWHQVLGSDTIPLPFSKAGGTVYGGDDACPSPLLYSNQTHASGEVTATVDGIYTIPCSNSGCDGQERYIAPELDSNTGFYNIANRGNLIWFAHKVSPITGLGELEGETTINGKLTADIDLGDYQTMIGTSNHPYAGEFDGDNHTVTVNYKTEEDYTALFRYTNGANIHDISTAGAITTSKKFAAGLVGYCQNATIQRCASSITITSSVNGDGTHGGIVANINTASTVSDCLFNGIFSGNKTTNCGGIIGWASPAITVSNCLYVNNGVFSTSGACTISRGKKVTIDNCYYSKAFGTEQGVLMSQTALASGEVSSLLNKGVIDGTQAWYQTLVTDVIPTLDTTHKTVYSGEDVCPSGSSSFGNTTHNVSTYSDGVATCQNEGCGKEVYQVPSYNAITETHYIGNKGNFLWFAGQVNLGITTLKGELTADINLSDNQTMLGTSSLPYAGVFDGNNFCVTINYTTSDQYTALFRYTKAATIRNLTTAGSITASGNFAAGIVAYSDNTLIESCSSRVNITGKSGCGYVGGIVGQTTNGGNINNCIYTGTVKGEEISQFTQLSLLSFGGIVGEATDTVTVVNCLLICRAGNSIHTASKPIISWAVGVNVSMENCYFNYESESNKPFSKTQGTEVTTAQLQSGEVCYSLNNQVSDSTQIWYQTLGTDDFPYPSTLGGASGSTVYGGEDACPSIQAYSNNIHSYDYTIEESTGNLKYYCKNAGCTHYYIEEYIPEYLTETNTYVLRTNSQLAWFATNVNSGACNSANATVENDLTMTTDMMIGNSTTYKYKGTFNGNDHTITISFSARRGKGVGLFGYTDGATISHVVTKGTSRAASTNVVYDGGIVANAVNTLIDCCSSSVKLYTNDWRNGAYSNIAVRCGGIVGYADANTRISNCCFTGSFHAWYLNQGKWGLIVCSTAGATVSNCIAANVKSYTVSENATAQLVESQSSMTAAFGSGADVVNCYYLDGCGEGDGTEKSSAEFSSGNVCNLLNGSVSDGTQSWYQTIGSDTYPLPDSSHGTVYAGTKACPTTKTYSNQTHTTTGERTDGDGYHYTACTTSGCSGVYEYEQPEYDTASETYQIANGGNLCWLSEQFTLTCIDEANSMLLNDIDMTGCNYTPMGIDYDKPYKGLFDGKGYRIKNMSLSTNQGGYGFFGHVAGDSTVIKNLIIDSSCSVTSTSGGGVAGLIGCVQSTSGTTCSVYVFNCGNEANVKGYQNAAGIIGGVYTNDNTHIYVYNTFNSGTISGSCESAAMCGYARCNYSFVNCYNSGTVTGVSSTTNYFYRNASDGTHLCTNCYDIHSGQTNVISTDDIANGTLCKKLNLNCGEYATWTQDISTDTHPVFGEGGYKYTRKSPYQWGTIVLPFDVTISGSDPYTFYKPSGVIGNALLMNGISDKLTAGTPALIYMKDTAKDADGNYALSLSCQGDVSSTINDISITNGPTLTGVYTSTDLTSVSGYMFSNGNLVNITSVQDCSCEPYHAYFAGTVSGSPQQLTLITDSLKISTAQELITFASGINSGVDWNNHIAYLANDIEMDPEFSPIGTSACPFKGTFDGQGYHIKSLLMLNSTTETGVGLFGVVAGENTIIKNVIIDSAGMISSTSTTAKGIAGLVGYVDSNGDKCNVTIQNCGNETKVVVAASECVAGILGGVSANDNTQVTIENCYNNSIINSGTDATNASICGYAGNNFTIANCYNNGTVSYTTDGYHLYRYNTSSSSSNQSVSNCYDTNCSQTGVTQITASQVTSGELCQKLNVGSTVFQQELETETYPIPGAAGLHYARTMTNQWGTICLPYAAEIGNDYDFYELSGISGDVLTLTKVSTLEAGKPAIVHRNASATGIDVSPVSGSVFVNTPVTGSSANGLTLTGAFTSTDITNKDGYIIANNSFWNIADIKGENNVYCAPFRAWLSGSISSGAKQLTIGFGDDTPTAAETINAITTGAAEYYDLNGHKLSDLQQGVNILKFKNGTTKKVIVK